MVRGIPTSDTTSLFVFLQLRLCIKKTSNNAYRTIWVKRKRRNQNIGNNCFGGWWKGSYWFNYFIASLLFDFIINIFELNLFINIYLGLLGCCYSFLESLHKNTDLFFLKNELWGEQFNLLCTCSFTAVHYNAMFWKV